MIVKGLAVDSYLFTSSVLLLRIRASRLSDFPLRKATEEAISQVIQCKTIVNICD